MKAGDNHGKGVEDLEDWNPVTRVRGGSSRLGKEFKGHLVSLVKDNYHSTIVTLYGARKIGVREWELMKWAHHY